jgi:acetyl esterase/lipase
MGGTKLTRAYDPSKRYEVKVWDVEFRRDPARTLMARIYQPQGESVFPALLDVHGGAWNNQDRTANAPMDKALAASGLLVVAIDLRLAPEAPYPASVADANYGIRWLKANAGDWNGDPATVGALGSSSGGHVIELCALRPGDPRYNVHRPAHGPDFDAALAYVATRSPVSDPFARFQQAEKMQRAEMIRNTQTYFDPWETIFEGNPQQILERGENTSLPPLLIMQGELDDNVLPAVQERFAAAYRLAGGECQLEIFPGCEHMWVKTPGPQTERAIETVKSFIARQLRTRRLAIV